MTSLHEERPGGETGAPAGRTTETYGDGTAEHRQGLHRRVGRSRRGLRTVSTAADLFDALSRGADLEMFRRNATAAVAGVRQARDRNAERRRRVLSHEDLTKRLKATLGPNADRWWTGYVPPQRDPEEACPACLSGRCRGVDHFAKASGSPVRAVLVDIAAEAMRREGGEHG